MIVWNSESKEYEPCPTCLGIIMETAYCDGFHRPDDEVPTVDPDFDAGGDASDITWGGVDYE